MPRDGDAVAVEHDEEAWYQNTRVVEYEELRNGDGELMSVKLKLRSDYMNSGDDGPIVVSEENFFARAKVMGGPKEVRLNEFGPCRGEDAAGLYFTEFPIFWEAVGELDARGFTVDTGCMQYSGGQEGYDR